MTHDDFDQLVYLSILLVCGGFATLLLSLVLIWIGRGKTHHAELASATPSTPQTDVSNNSPQA